MKILYAKKRFSRSSLEVIDNANEIIAYYKQGGFTLTLRQLYYQFVSRGLMPNQTREYNRLGNIISDGRIAGHIDWDAIVDNLREVNSNSHWNSVSEILGDCSRAYRVNLWKGQKVMPEVWVEKDALSGIVAPVCQRWDVPYLVCRGYASQSALWRAGQRMLYEYIHKGQEPVILHLGDHDPSGIDMTRDIVDRLFMFTDNRGITVKRIALNMDLVDKFKLPPNPAKQTDSRFAGYHSKYGDESWELDAVDPKVLSDIISDAIDSECDFKILKKNAKLQKQGQDKIRKIAQEVDDNVKKDGE